MTDKEKLALQHLARFVSEHKKNFIDKVLSVRTRHVTIVMEDIYQSQNASAVIRTAECMGLQDVHIIEQQSKYDINPRVLKGSNKWMTLHRYRDRTINNTEKCFEALHERGYRILVTDPDPDGTPVDEVEVGEQKLALVFGNELRGVSDYAKQHADMRITIPMFGFTESLNISVSVAICLKALISRLHQYEGNWTITDDEKQQLRLDWYRKIVRRSQLIEREFLRTIE